MPPLFIVEMEHDVEENIDYYVLRDKNKTSNENLPGLICIVITFVWNERKEKRRDGKDM